MKRLKRRILAGLLAFVMCISTVNVTAFAQENETSSEIQETVAVSETGSSNEASTENIEITDTYVSGNNVEPVEEKLLNENQEQLTNEKIYENENYNVTFSLTSSWESGYNANVKIENTGDDTIQNWYLSFEYDDQITNIWNAEISTHEENQYIVKNAGWNQDIVAGGSIEFGISGSTAFNEFPENFNVVGENKEVQEEDYSVHYQVDSDWGSGFTGSIQITNNTDKILEDWVLEFDFEREITNIWNAVIECHEGNHYVIRNAGYNANINAGQMVSFGFNGMNGSKDIVPENNKLYSYEASIEIDLNLDSDNDGAEDYIEDYFGTDKKKEDTDGDGLSDYIEIFIIGSEPTIIDTDQNGINDGDEDADQDGLSNLSEVEIGTDLIKIDTDSDGLSDYEEKNTYQTNSLEYDTDQDNVSDGTEIELGTNPLVYDENFDLCITATDEDTVKVSVEMNLSGVQVETLSVEKYENEFFFPTSMPGYIGGAYDFSVDGEFDKATINFEFDEILLEDSSFDPVIYHFNEEKQLLEELETTVSGNVASAQVTHFSKYILLNRKVFQSAFEWQDVWSTTGYTGVEIVLVIDDSGSLGGDYSYNATDNDGVLDGKEVCELKYEYNSDKTKVIVTGKLISSPLEPDSDYDGKPDSTDKAPLNNHFTGTLTTEYATSNIAFDMDYRWFFNDNNIYCEDLSITSSLFASAIYQPNSLSIIDSEKMDTTSGTSMSDIMNYFGMSNTKTIELKDTYNDIHVSEVGVGYRTVSYNGENKNIIAVVVRGTNGTIDEWSSNFEIGKLGDFESEVDWINVDNHMGFDIAANRIINIVSQYVSDNQLEMNECAYWITGHSRGAAIANIIGAYYENEQKRAYTYTYAAPNTTMNADASDYKTIFNVVNADDFVPCLPMTSWGYTRYGKTASISLSANYEKEWENLTGIWDYNPDTYGMQDTVDALGDIIASGDAREEVYKYTCNCHGDNSIDTITVTNYGISKDSREKAIAKIPSNALPYCTITRYDGWLVGGWNFDNCQTPAYFMQILAAQMSGELTKKQFVVDINIAKRYENAKTAVIKSAIGGLSHPHYTESYYILSNNLTNGAFK